jgi:conjugal transfer mating pair stabilization protein TraN
MTTHPCIAGTMQTAQSAAQAFGEKQNVHAIQSAEDFKVNEWMPQNGNSFDGEEARQNLDSHQASSTEIIHFLTSAEVRRNERENKHFHQGEVFLNSSEDIATHANQYFQSEQQESHDRTFSIHTCKQAGDPFLISTERTLNVQVNHIPAEQTKICLGHKKRIRVKKKENVEKATKTLTKKYKKDPNIKPKSVEVTLLYAHPTSDDYWFQVYYEHIDNGEGCNKCKNKKVKEETYQEVGEEWVLENRDLWNLSKHPDSTVIEHVCLDITPKTIHGKEVDRQCWRERISFLYQFPRTKECESLKNHLCEQIDQRCIHPTPLGCAMWEITYQCDDQIARQFIQTDSKDLYGFKEFKRNDDSRPNQSFAEVAAKLSIFDQAKKELETSKTFDAKTLEIFKGQRISCSKNVADHLIYDCCFSYSGLAKQMGLSKCSADEISLADMREQGVCHYVGSYEEKVLNLWKSRDEHVFCCFPSKLARIVQEQGRKQMGMDWGSPEKPQCGGFSFELLAKLDFNKIDLSEMFDQLPRKLPESFQDKMDTFQNRLKEQIQKEESNRENQKRSGASQ